MNRNAKLWSCGRSSPVPLARAGMSIHFIPQDAARSYQVGLWAAPLTSCSVVCLRNPSTWVAPHLPGSDGWKVKFTVCWPWSANSVHNRKVNRPFIKRCTACCSLSLVIVTRCASVCNDRQYTDAAFQSIFFLYRAKYVPRRPEFLMSVKSEGIPGKSLQTYTHAYHTIDAHHSFWQLFKEHADRLFRIFLKITPAQKCGLYLSFLSFYCIVFQLFFL